MKYKLVRHDQSSRVELASYDADREKLLTMLVILLPDAKSIKDIRDQLDLLDKNEIEDIWFSVKDNGYTFQYQIIISNKTTF